MEISASWEFVADSVMGGVSQGALTDEIVRGRPAARLTGRVSLENNGGFVQMAADLAGPDAVFDASGGTGIELDLCGNGEEYDVRLRTDALARPWQSFRTVVTVAPEWRRHRLPFETFVPHKTELSLDPARLRRIGILAIGRVFDADVSVAGLRFYGQIGQ